MNLHPAALAALLLASAACDIRVNENGGVSVDIAEGTARDEWTRTYTLAPGGRFEIVNQNGAISAVPATGGQVEVRAQREVKTQEEATSRELLKKVEMIEEVSAARVKIESRSQWDQSIGGGLGRRPQLTIEYHLAVPPGLHVSLETENGAVRLENVNGTIVVSSTNGGINASGVSGSLSGATVNGGIQVDLAEVTGEVSLVTVNGGIRLELPANVKATLDARAVNGGVSVDEGLRLAATEQERLHVAGALNGGGPRISAETTNGGVRVSARGGGRPPG
jgi:hypothetical protein